MKILIGYPPTLSPKGLALLSQNRQFQWFSHETKIYPIIPASAATLLKARGHQVIWRDCIADGTDLAAFKELIRREQPELFAFETKTPVVKMHWQLVDELKAEFPAMRIALMGDHVSALPEETMNACKVDFVVCGGDYDFSLARLMEVLTKGTPMPKGILYRREGQVAGDKAFELNDNLDEAPIIDRDLTQWRLYQKEYNLRGNPFMYIMSGRDCWHGRCTFCAWTGLYPRFRARSVANVLEEVQMLVDRYGVNEIFDDSGTLNIGPWLRELCAGLIERGLHKKTMYSCNMRYGALKEEDFRLMKKAGFRLLKFGLESAQQSTLDRLQKKTRVEQIEEGCRMAKRAGLTVHLTMIIGYPWESSADALRTFDLAKHLMQRGYADVLQATTLVPYPGTPLYDEAVKNDWFLFDPKAYERFDMSEPILKTQMPAEEVRAICNRIYTIFLTPQYIYHRILSIRSWQDLAFLTRGAKAVIGHLRDFGGQRKRAE